MTSWRGSCFELTKTKNAGKTQENAGETQETQGNAGALYSIYVEYLADAYDLKDGNDTFLLTYE